MARPRSIAIGALFSAVAAVACAPSHAQGRVEVQYEATLAGIPIGRGGWTIDVADDHYAASGKGGSAGLLNVFADGSGFGAVQGRVVGGQLVPQSYSSTLTSSRKSETIRLAITGGAIKDIAIEPEWKPDSNRIPLTDAHKRGVLDPMTGALLRAAGSGEPVSPEACRGATPVFDGRMRYDLKLDFKRMETVKAEKGYRGPVVVCGVSFLPLAGYNPDRSTIKYLIAQRNMEVWFAPIEGTRMLAPFRVKVPTTIGMAMLDARQFVTQATPAKAASRAQ